MDKEYEIPERFRTLISDAQSEKEVREIFEKAYGLDYAKPKHEALQQKYQLWQNGMNTLQSYLREGNYDEFFKFWGMPEEKLLQYAYERVQYKNLSPEERAKVDSEKNQVAQARQRDSQLEQLQGAYTQTLRRVAGMELDTAMSRPDISSVAKEFDTRAGQPGAFRREVINRGALHYYTTGKDIPVAQAIQEVMTVLGYEEVADQGPQAPTQAPSVAPVVEKKLPVIPNVGGSGPANPVKKQVRSLDDIRKLAGRTL